MNWLVRYGQRELFWRLDEEGNPVPEASVILWSGWFTGSGEERTVAFTDVGNARVSTVFLGLDTGIGSGVPLLFETMISGGEHDREARRYAMRNEALAGHKEVVQRLQKESS